MKYSGSRLKSIQIPTFTGNKKAYRAWRVAFMACVEQTNSSPEVKLLHLKQYLGGEALAAIESPGYSAHAYEAAVKRLDPKIGGEQRQTDIQFEEIRVVSRPPNRQAQRLAAICRFA
eukprot:scpid89152/ scgid14043/ 